MKKNTIKEIIYFIIPAVISLFIALFAMKIWTIDFSTVKFPESDERMGYMMFKSIKEYGISGALFNPRIGAPEVSALIDTPFLDWPMIFMIWILTRFLNYYVAYYVFYFLTYITASFSMYVLLRKLTNKYWLCICLSISYAITPFHFYRSVVHMTLSNYYVIPIGLYLALLVYEKKWKFGIPEFLNHGFFKKCCFIFAVIAVSLSNVYYAFFSMLLVLITVIYKTIEHKSWKILCNEALLFLNMCIIFIAGLLPKIIYGFINGKNTTAGFRDALETELYGLKIIQLFLPPSYSKISLLSNINQKYTQMAININENSWSNMGLIASIGFLVLCIWFLCTYIKPAPRTILVPKLKLFVILALAILLYCTVGGLGTIFSYVLTPELRCLNRGSIVLVTISIAFLAILIENINYKLYLKIAEIALPILLIFTIYAEVDYKPDYWTEESEQLAKEYSDFFNQIEMSVDEDDMVYQLPMTQFPESVPVYKIDDYSHFIAYLYTDKLKWSYGGVKGRNTIATNLFIDNGMSDTFFQGIKSAGYSGIYIDGYGYEDNGAEIVLFYTNLLKQKPLISSDGRFYFFKI